MKKLGFQGFPFGSSLTLQGQSAGKNDIISLEGWGINANIEIDISRSALRVAPERFTFQVIAWTGFNTTVGDTPPYDARLHEIVYFADFGEVHSLWSLVLPKHESMIAIAQSANLGSLNAFLDSCLERFYFPISNPEWIKEYSKF